MKRRLTLCLLLLVLATDLRAHRLDEYLQAARLSVASNRIDLSIDLTPGVAVAARVISEIDTNHDQQVSGIEATGYAHRVLKDLRIRLDEKVVPLRLVDVAFPALREIKGGSGVIRIKATSVIPRLAQGSHTLHLRNRHLPAISVYHVNAVKPKDATIEITRQTRDRLQQAYRMDFTRAPSPP